jgi:hypothetical protein
MSSIAKTRKRSKTTTHFGAVPMIRPAQDGAFDVDSKLECIRELILLGVMHVRLSVR